MEQVLFGGFENVWAYKANQVFARIRRHGANIKIPLLLYKLPVEFLTGG
jgi:hypothetical protein